MSYSIFNLGYCLCNYASHEDVKLSSIYSNIRNTKFDPF